MTDKNGLTEEDYLKKYKIKNYEKPSITVDNILFAMDEIITNDIRKLNEKRLQILLVKRVDHPFLGKWGLPGTFVKIEETLEEASIRSLEKKTSLKDIYLEQLYTFGDIDRDPRARILSVSYMGLVDKKNTNIKMDKNADWFTVKLSAISDVLFELILNNEKDIIIKVKIESKNSIITILDMNEISFDHAKIIFYGLDRMRNKLEYTDIAFSMLGEEFTMSELQQVYEVILDKKFTKANFQRKIKSKLKELDKYKTGGFRPAKLYKYIGEE